MPAAAPSFTKIARQWSGHMRRGLQLRSERDFLAALALVPELGDPQQGLVKTLRGLGDLYAEQGRLEEAALLFERLGAEVAAPTKIFLCDYVRLLFRLAEEELRGKHVSKANDALEKVQQLAQRASGHAEMEALTRDGWLNIGSLFEQAGDWAPAELYIGRAVEIRAEAGKPDNLQVFAELAWRAYWRRDFERADHWAERALGADEGMLHARLGSRPARAASFLGALGSAAAQNHLAKVSEHYFSWAKEILAEAFPQGSLELADLLVAWGSCTKPELLAELRYQEALQVRESLLGERHPKVKELRRALGLEADAAFRQGFSFEPAAAPTIRMAFDAPRPATASELKGLQRRLVKMAHPDQAQGEEEFALRNHWMIEINEATDHADGKRLLELMRRVRQELQRRGWLRSA